MMCAAFTLPNQDGTPVASTDWRGRKVVLFVFVRAESEICTAHIHAIREVYPQFQAAGVLVYGIGIDPPDVLKRWHSANALPFDLLCDADHRVLEALGAWDDLSFKARDFAAPLRGYVVLDTDGTILAQAVRVTVQMSIDGALQIITPV